MSEQSPVARDFYLVTDICAVTGLSRASVQEGIRRGELPGYKVGARYVIPGNAFRAFCEGRWMPQVREEAPTDTGSDLSEATDEPRQRDPQQFIRHFEDYGHAV